MAEIDDKIMGLFETLNKQIKGVEDMERATKRPWKTNCSMAPVFGGGNPINIAVQTVPAILQLYSDLLVQQEFSNRAAKELGIVYDGKWSGFLIDDWKEDFLKRIAIINLKQQKDKLEDLEDRLTNIISPEQRRQMEMDAIMKELGETE